jgi:hypothetical protein
MIGEVDTTSKPIFPQVEPELHRFTVEEYMRLGESFPRSELLDGLVYDKPRGDEPEPQLHRFTFEEYMRLGDSFPRSELLDGLIYDVSPTNRGHAHALRVLVKALVLGLVEKPYWVEQGSSLAVQGWEGPWGPEPDIAVLHDETYSKTPTAENAAALIEVSDSSYAWDRKHKIPLYVASGVPTWQVNLPARQVEYSESPESLDSPQIFLEGDTFEVLGVRIAVADLLLPVEGKPDA